MKLYYLPGACSLAPHIALNELGLDFQLVRVDHKTHQTEDGRDFRALSPFGYVPLLELDDGSLLREGPAVLQYLADLRPASLLVPVQGSLERYRLLEWLAFLNSEIHKGFIPLLYAVAAGKYRVGTARAQPGQRDSSGEAPQARKRHPMCDGFTAAPAPLYA